MMVNYSVWFKQLWKGVADEQHPHIHEDGYNDGACHVGTDDDTNDRASSGKEHPHPHADGDDDVARAGDVDNDVEERSWMCHPSLTYIAGGSTSFHATLAMVTMHAKIRSGPRRG